MQKDIAENKIYNCSGSQGITFKGLINQAAIACSVDPSKIDFRSFDPGNATPKSRKSFPLRTNHYLVNINRLQSELDWQPKYSLLEGLRDCYENDYKIAPTINPNFSADENLY